jgi:hypothetical protein
MVVMVCAVSGASRVGAAPAPIHRGADVKFTVGGSAKESVVTAEGLGVRITKRVGPETVNIRIEALKDIVDLEASAKGGVRLSRRGRSVAINMGARDQKLIAEARRVTDGSLALKSFDALIQKLDGDPRAVAQSMWITWALVSAARGDDAAAMSVAGRFKAAANRRPFTPVKVTLEREEGPNACWVEYASTVYNYYLEFSACLVDYAWMVGMAQACTFEWMVKSELAWFYLIACDGGIPA